MRIQKILKCKQNFRENLYKNLRKLCKFIEDIPKNIFATRLLCDKLIKLEMLFLCYK